MQHSLGGAVDDTGHNTKTNLPEDVLARHPVRKDVKNVSKDGSNTCHTRLGEAVTAVGSISAPQHRHTRSLLTRGSVSFRLLGL